VHAGEWAGPDRIREALETLPVQRLGHGVRAIEDPSLVKDIVARDVTLEVCPGSNVATGLYKSLSDHPIRNLMSAGVNVTLNSDDPPYFATTVGNEYDKAESVIGLSPDELRRITKAAITASFAEPDIKARLLALPDLA
jgi:adenosine deaminase